MNKLWVFGDSFTAGAGVLKDQNGYYSPATLEYRKFIGADDNSEILTWPQILCNHFGLELKNVSLGGWSNESIFDAFFKNIKNIEKDDTVILGLTYFHRFDVKLNSGIQSFSINRVMGEDENFLNENQLSKDGLLKIVTNRADDEFVHRLIAQVEAVKYLTKDFCKVCLVWCHDSFITEKNPTSFIKMYSDRYGDFEFFKHDYSITASTNGLVRDGHFGIEGHLEFGKILIKNLEELI